MIIEGLLVAFVVLFGSFFLIGGALLIKGVAGHLWERWGAFFAALESQRWATTTGKVTRAVVTYTTWRRGRRYAPAIRYTYSVGGEAFVSERFAFDVSERVGDEGARAVGDEGARAVGDEGARAVVERFPAGGNVEVYYDPKNPKRATLDRAAPPVVGPTLGWLFVLLVGAGVMLPLGFSIVRGPFEDPPNLGDDVPSLSAQLGGVAAAFGAILVLVAGVRAIGGEERRQRRLLRRLESVKPTLIRELRAGEPVLVSGRAEELELPLGADAEDAAARGTADEDIPGEGESEDEIEQPGSVELPFEDAPLVYYDADVEWFRRTCFNVFGVRDASGVVLVELEATESTLLQSRRLPIAGEVERWLDEQRDDIDDPISAHPEWLRLERIRKGDPVLLAGYAEREDDDLVFRAKAGDPTSLLVADGSREEILGRLGKRLGKTRAFFLVGGGLIVVGAVAMMVPFP